MTPYIAELQNVIRKLYGVESAHLRGVPVKETFQGKTVWDGTVEVFHLVGHPETETAYAWTYDTGKGRRKSVAVLEVPPVDSPHTAVRAAILKDVRQHGKA